jgi:hypothetical protein
LSHRLLEAIKLGGRDTGRLLLALGIERLNAYVNHKKTPPAMTGLDKTV